MSQQASLASLLSSFTDPKVVKQLSRQTQAKPAQINQLIQLGLPTLIQALNTNAQTPTGAKALQNALNQHASDPVSDLSSFLGSVDQVDGSKIIGHILGSKTDKVQTKLSAQTGLQTNQVGSLLSSLAPLLMGTLAQQNLNAQPSSGGLQGLLGNLVAGSGDDLVKMAMGLLDSDHDGDVMDDVGKLLGGFLGKR